MGKDVIPDFKFLSQGHLNTNAASNNESKTENKDDSTENAIANKSNEKDSSVATIGTDNTLLHLLSEQADSNLFKLISNYSVSTEMIDEILVEFNDYIFQFFNKIRKDLTEVLFALCFFVSFFVFVSKQKCLFCD